MANKNPKEYQVRKFIADYLLRQYPNTIYRFDLAADLALSGKQAKRNQRLQPQKGYPDLFIAEPRGEYSGFYIEIKRKGQSPYLKDGSVSTISHIQNQWEFLKKLRERGYKAEFGIGIDHTKELIDEYLST